MKRYFLLGSFKSTRIDIYRAVNTWNRYEFWDWDLKIDDSWLSIIREDLLGW